MKKTNFKTLCNRLLEGAIRMCMLTGITFLVTACYAPANPVELLDPESPEYQERQDLIQRVEQMSQQDQTTSENEVL
jgi:hypothetical protein